MSWPLTQLPRIPGGVLILPRKHKEKVQAYCVDVSRAFTEIKYLSENTWKESWGWRKAARGLLENAGGGGWRSRMAVFLWKTLRRVNEGNFDNPDEFFIVLVTRVIVASECYQRQLGLDYWVCNPWLHDKNQGCHLFSSSALTFNNYTAGSY